MSQQNNCSLDISLHYYDKASKGYDCFSLYCFYGRINMMKVDMTFQNRYLSRIMADRAK